MSTEQTPISTGAGTGQPATETDAPAADSSSQTPTVETSATGSTLSHEAALSELSKARAEAANYRTRLRDAEGRLDSAKTAEEYEQAVSDIKTRNGELEQQLARERVARKYHLPDDLATRLHGATAEELEADARALQKYATPTEPVVLSGGLNPADDSDTETDPRVLARRYGGRRR